MGYSFAGAEATTAMATTAAVSTAPPPMIQAQGIGLRMGSFGAILLSWSAVGLGFDGSGGGAVVAVVVLVVVVVGRDGEIASLTAPAARSMALKIPAVSDTASSADILG
jgi:hypothetical protein